MKILDITNATHVFAKNQPEYQDLPVMAEVVGDTHTMTSLWQPTEEELAALNEGGAVRLSVMGYSHPPVLLTVQDKNSEIVNEQS